MPQYSDLVYDKLLREARPEFGQSVLSSEYQEPSNEGNSSIAIFIGFNCAVLQQLCGINVVVLYCGDIFEQVISNDYVKMCRLLLQASQLIGCFGTAYFIKKYGRKTLLQIGAIGIGITLVVIAACYMSKS